MTAQPEAGGLPTCRAAAGGGRRARVSLCGAGIPGGCRPVPGGEKTPPLFERGRVWWRFQGDSSCRAGSVGKAASSRRKAFFASFLSPHKKDGPRGRAEPASMFGQARIKAWLHSLKAAGGLSPHKNSEQPAACETCTTLSGHSPHASSSKRHPLCFASF